jgi:hypothetical protein
MSKQVIRLGVVAMSSAAVLGAGAVSAGATTPSTTSPQTLSGVQAKAAAAITARVNALNAAVSDVNADKSLGTDQSGLDTYLQRDIAPLQALGTKIAADTTLAEAQADAAGIYTDYRVFALVLPAAAQAADTDRITVTTIPAFTAFSAKAQSDVTANNQATLAPMIASLNTDISGATNATSGLASTVMGYVPSQWNANNGLLGPTKAQLATANGDVKSARTEVQAIRQYFKSSHPAVVAPTTPTTGA